MLPRAPPPPLSAAGPPRVSNVSSPAGGAVAAPPTHVIPLIQKFICDCPERCKIPRFVTKKIFNRHRRWRSTSDKGLIVWVAPGSETPTVGRPANAAPGTGPPSSAASRRGEERGPHGAYESDSEDDMPDLESTSGSEDEAGDDEYEDDDDGAYDPPEDDDDDPADDAMAQLPRSSSQFEDPLQGAYQSPEAFGGSPVTSQARRTPRSSSVPRHSSPPGPFADNDEGDVSSEESDPEVGYTEGQGAPADARRKDYREAEYFVRALKAATLDDSGLDSETINRLRAPPHSTTIPTGGERAGLRMYMARGDASEDNYADNRAAFLELAPDADIPSYYQVKKLISNLTGIHALRVEMCVNTCVAFTGPFEDLTECPRCRQPRYDMVALEHGQKVPRRTFPTFPLGPQLQAMWSSPENATLMRHRARETERILPDADTVEVIDDVYYGNEYLALAHTPDPGPDGTPGRPRIGPDDTTLMFSIDGAQLYRSKASDCWFYIWVLLDLPPTSRYKKRYVLPGAVIPGPNKPKNVDSFLFPGLYHLAAIQREGLQIWDAAERREFRSRLYLLLVTADSPAMAYLNGLVGHTGMNMCRLYCGREGRHKPSLGTYYPALLRPDGDVLGPADISLRVDDPPADAITPAQRHRNNLMLVRAARTNAAYARARLETGIAKPSIFSGLPKRRFLGVPGGFVLDLMHLITLNMTDLFISLLRGTIACEPTDDKDTWEWAVFRDRTAWQAHGTLVAESARYLPMSFDRPPRNPAEKISSGYKAWEFLLYVYGLLPGFLRHVQAPIYYRHFCLAVSSVRVVLQYRQKINLLPAAQRNAIEYIEQYEDIYYQRRMDRLHFVRPSLHTFGHVVPEIFRVGPGALHTQWTMENYIGNITREIKQHITPYSNVGERALRRCQINALKAIIPELAEPEPSFPSGAMDLGGGYALLHATDRVERRVTAAEGDAIRSFLLDQGVVLADEGWQPIVRRWARLAIPNKQVARSAWKEELKERRGKQPRRSRMVKLQGDTFAEVRYYFPMMVNDTARGLAMIVPFSEPNAEILEYSRSTLVACTYPGPDICKVVFATDIISVVAMVPLPMTEAEASQPDAHDRYGHRFFVVEKPGLDIAQFAGRGEDAGADEDGFDLD